MNFLSRLRVTVGDRVVQSFVDGGWSPLEWRADDGLRLLLECEPRRLAGDDDESEDGMSRFSVTLTIAAPGDRTSRQLVVREDGAVLSQDGEAEFAAEFFSMASRARLAVEGGA